MFWDCGRIRFDLTRRAVVMGILNVTPDSFSDGGQHAELDAALAHARRMIVEGAEIIDIGGESTRPGADPVSAGEECARVVPVIKALRAESPVAISIDTMKAEVARAALDAGADIVNDVTALTGDPAMPGVVRESRCGVALMHMIGTPRTMQQNPDYDEVVTEVCEYLQTRRDALEAAGIARERIALDPGIGFGKTLEHNLQLLRELDRLVALGSPILVGTSRKSFIGAVLDLPAHERLEGSLATIAWAARAGAQIMRVHDVAPTVRTLRMTEALMQD